MMRALLGSRAALPPDLLERYPELRGARFRMGGLPLLVGGWFLGKRRVDAITLWRTVFVAKEIRASPELLLHELRHVQQFCESRTFPLRYIWETVRRGYLENPFEREARSFAARRVSDPATSSSKDV